MLEKVPLSRYALFLDVLPHKFPEHLSCGLALAPACLKKFLADISFNPNSKTHVFGHCTANGYTFVYPFWALTVLMSTIIEHCLHPLVSG